MDTEDPSSFGRGLRDISLEDLLAIRPPQSPSQPKVSNALSSKVTTIISSSYVDPEFRRALALFDERNIQNTPEARRRLPLQLMKEVLDGHGAMIGDFGRLADRLRQVGSIVDGLMEEFSDMKAQVTANREAVGPILEEAESILKQKAEAEQQQEMAAAFRTRFVLTEQENAALTLISEPIDDHFFDTIAKSKRIIKECEVLLGHENQSVGLELIEQTTKNLNFAYQKLYKWTQREFGGLNLENPQMNASIRRALRVLAERPSLFESCLARFSQARERILSDAFFLALTGTLPTGAPDHSVKPIDMTAHDPLRYAGDMLAWTHSAAVSEREALEVLFVSDGEEIARGLQTGRQNELWHLAVEDGESTSEFEALKALSELVDKDISGVARLIRQRLEQVIQSNEEVIPAYKLVNLLGFYGFTFRKLLGETSVLVESVSAAEVEALRQFRSLVREQISVLQSDFQQIPTDLRPPSFFQDALGQLSALMNSYESSISTSNDRETGFEPILEEAFEPFISGCENMAASLPNPSNSVFLVNCLLVAIAVLIPFDFTRRRMQKLRDVVALGTKSLSDTQYLFFRTGSGLDELLSTLQELESPGELRKLPAFEEQALSHASQVLDNFLPSALMDAMENLRELQDTKMAREITEEAADRFCADFARIEQCLALADGQDEGHEDSKQNNLREIFPRTLGEIRVLLS